MEKFDVRTRKGLVALRRVALRNGVWGLVPLDDRGLLDLVVRQFTRVRWQLLIEELTKTANKVAMLVRMQVSRFFKGCVRVVFGAAEPMPSLPRLVEAAKRIGAGCFTDQSMFDPGLVEYFGIQWRNSPLSASAVRGVR